MPCTLFLVTQSLLDRLELKKVWLSLGREVERMG